MPLKSTCFIFLFSLYKSASTAPPLSLSSLTLDNSTVPFQDAPTNPSLSARPHDPTELNSDWEGPGFITVTFSNYGADIPLRLALRCTDRALLDARRDHGNVWNQPIGKSELLYTNLPASSFAVLGVLPGAAMTWNMLYYAVFLVRHFASEIQSMAFEFEVEVTGVQGLAAKGNLSRIARFWS